MKGLSSLEKASMSILLDLLLLRLVLPLFLSPVFFFSLPYIFYFASFTKIKFLDKGRDRFLFGLVFPILDYSCPRSSIRPFNDVVASCSTVSHFLGLDLLSLSTIHKDAFCATLVVLASASKVPQYKVVISEALAETSSVFPALDRAVNSNMEISSKLDVLKR